MICSGIPEHWGQAFCLLSRDHSCLGGCPLTLLYPIITMHRMLIRQFLCVMYMYMYMDVAIRTAQRLGLLVEFAQA